MKTETTETSSGLKFEEIDFVNPEAEAAVVFLGNGDETVYGGAVAEGVLQEKEKDPESSGKQINDVQAIRIGLSGLGMFLKERKSKKIDLSEIRLKREKFGKRLAYLNSLDEQELNKEEAA